MTDQEIRKIILETFEQIRQSSNTAFDESRFLDFLLQPPASKDNIKNSFKGAKKYFDFFRAIELRFGICFSDADQDKFYSIDKFVLKTKDRLENSRGNKMIIQRRVSEKDHYYLEFLLTLISALIVSYFKMHFVSAIAILILLVAIWWLLRGRVQDKRHTIKLYKKIVGKDYSKREVTSQRTIAKGWQHFTTKK